VSTDAALVGHAPGRPTTPAAGSAGQWSTPALTALALITVLLVLSAYIAIQVDRPDRSASGRSFPHSADMEKATGVQFSRVAIVGDGGLVLVEYVVEDVEKATAFQADRPHVPSVTSEARPGGTNRVSIMKPGHLIRAGQTYYFIYQNTGGALRSGELATIRYLDHELADVPVQ
jgi:hypothetical protein